MMIAILTPADLKEDARPRVEKDIKSVTLFDFAFVDRQHLEERASLVLFVDSRHVFVLWGTKRERELLPVTQLLRVLGEEVRQS